MFSIFWSVFGIFNNYPVRPNIHFTTAPPKYVWKLNFFLLFRSSWILISRNQNRYSITSDHGKFDGQMLHLLLDLWKAVIAVTILKTANFRFEVARQKRKYSEAGLSWLVQAGNDSRPRKEAQWSKLWKFISDKS